MITASQRAMEVYHADLGVPILDDPTNEDLQHTLILEYGGLLPRFPPSGVWFWHREANVLCGKLQ